MALSFFDSDVREYIDNWYRHYKLDDEHIIIMTDSGSWVSLTNEEFTLLRHGKVREDPNLFRLLEDKGIILTMENAPKVVKDYRERHHFLFRGPSLHIITPTMRCNQRCVYCHSRAEPDNSEGFDMDEDTARKTVDFILSTPVQSLTIEFQGGECLLNFDVVRSVISYATERAEKLNKKVGFDIVTNLTKIDDSILKELAKYQKPGENPIIRICTSLDGPKEVHDKNRAYLGGLGSYDDVVYWIRKIKEDYNGVFFINALPTITRHSLGSGKEIVDEYESLGLKNLWLRFLHNLGFASDSWAKIGYTPEEYLDFRKQVLDYMIKEEKDVREMYSVIMLKKILNKEDPNFTDLMSPCGAGLGQLLYNYRGGIYTCDEGKLYEMFRLGGVKTDRYQDIFRTKTFSAMADISSKLPLLCDACPWSPYCGVCPVLSYASTGNVIPKVMHGYRCEIYEGMIKDTFRRLILSQNDRNVMMSWLNTKTLDYENNAIRHV